MAIDPSAVWDFAREVVGAARPDRGRTLATVTRIGADGTVWVTTGDGGEAPAGSVAAGVSVGDTVTLEWDGSAMGIRGNVSNPSPAGSVIRRAVERTRSVADAAQKVADAVNQHFFADTHGIHVTEATQEEWDESHTGANVLINSIGQLFRDGLNNLLTLTTEGNARALTIWDGLGNAAANVRAVIGETITLGNAASGSVVTIDSDSMDMVHGTTEMLHFGYGEGNATSGTAVAPYYTLGTRLSGSAVGNHSMAIGYNVTASGAVSHAEGTATTATKPAAHAEGSETAASGTSSHAEGLLTTASGASSHAEGQDTIASGQNSHAGGQSTIAASAEQVAIGRYNVKDSASTYAFIIGNGAYNSRSNALTVGWSGNVNAAGTISSGYQVSVRGNGSTSDTQKIIALRSNSSGNRGLYDVTNDGWILYRDTNNDLVLGSLKQHTGTCTVTTANATIYGSANYCWRNAACATITICVNLKSALSTNSSVDVATAPSGFSPPHGVMGQVYITGVTSAPNLYVQLTSAGVVRIVNKSGSSVSTSANIYLSFTFAL